MFGSVSLSLPVHNDAAEGALMQQKSQLLQAQTQIYLQSSQVASNVVTAAKSVINTKRALEQAEASAENQRKSVVAQEQLFALGLSSIVEVITTETNLASADLTVATNQAQYAIDVAQLRFATGTLLPDNASEIYHLDLAEILRLPQVEGDRRQTPFADTPSNRAAVIEALSRRSLISASKSPSSSLFVIARSRTADDEDNLGDGSGRKEMPWEHHHGDVPQFLL